MLDDGGPAGRGLGEDDGSHDHQLALTAAVEVQMREQGVARASSEVYRNVYNTMYSLHPHCSPTYYVASRELWMYMLDISMFYKIFL